MKLKHDRLLSKFAFNCNLRHYTEGVVMSYPPFVTTPRHVMVGRCELTPG